MALHNVQEDTPLLVDDASLFPESLSMRSNSPERLVSRSRRSNVRVLPLKDIYPDDDDENRRQSGCPPFLAPFCCPDLLLLGGPSSSGAAFPFSAWLLRAFPCLQWMSTYDFSKDFRADCIAGLTVASMLVPQSMSYAKLAGLPAIYGLYTGFVPVLGYVIFGSSRQLAIGPVAIVSLLTKEGLTHMMAVNAASQSPPPPGPSILKSAEDAELDYIQLAITLSLLVGIFQTVMGCIRMGWLVRFLSRSVISGFTSGAALIIGISMAHSLLGVPGSDKSSFLGVLIDLTKSLMSGEAGWQTPTFGLCMMAILLATKLAPDNAKWLRAVGPLFVLVLGTVLCAIFGAGLGVAVVGPIPRGFPPISVSSWQFDQIFFLMKPAAVIMAVALLEGIGIAKALAARNGYDLDTNQELLGLGIANLLGSMFSAYPSAGSVSRSAVSNEAGARTALSGIVTAVVIMATLAFLTPLFEGVPQCVLAAIVMSAVVSLVDHKEALFLWKVEKKDWCLWMAAFLGTLLLGIEWGVAIAVVLSLLFVIHESANPHMAVLGRLPGTTVYRNIEQYPDAYTYAGIVVMRIDAPIYFANVDVIKEHLWKYELVHGDTGCSSDRVRFVVLDMTPVMYIDSTALHALKELHGEYQSRGVQLALCNPNLKVLRSLAKAGLPDLIGPNWYFVRVHDAILVCTSLLQKGSCPESGRASLRSDNPRRTHSYVEVDQGEFANTLRFVEAKSPNITIERLLSDRLTGIEPGSL
eukprot:TRINITY_DN29421_c0_g1_i1.p1 TRINITY_DN29421_c0_g1~~TRINITY_DN29421_c0_g1_i1.p1  ORF type:complete len:749 (+),score=108.01 TRINITY_DN29421_c0_g1_i1:318-2564(+)